MEDVGHESVAGAHVSMRMVVVSSAIVHGRITRINEGNCRQIAGKSVGQELRESRRNRNVLRTPEREKRNIGVVITRADACLSKPVPDRWESRDGVGIAQAVSLGGVLEDPIRER